MEEEVSKLRKKNCALKKKLDEIVAKYEKEIAELKASQNAELKNPNEFIKVEKLSKENSAESAVAIHAPQQMKRKRKINESNKFENAQIDAKKQKLHSMSPINVPQNWLARSNFQRLCWPQFHGNVNACIIIVQDLLPFTVELGIYSANVDREVRLIINKWESIKIAIIPPAEYIRGFRAISIFFDQKNMQFLECIFQILIQLDFRFEINAPFLNSTDARFSKSSQMLEMLADKAFVFGLIRKPSTFDFGQFYPSSNSVLNNSQLIGTEVEKCQINLFVEWLTKSRLGQQPAGLLYLENPTFALHNQIKKQFASSFQFAHFMVNEQTGEMLAIEEAQNKKFIEQKTNEEVFGAEKIFVSNDLLLEMFQFCNFRTAGTNFCVVNRRWNHVGQWHCQNRPHRIPYMILNVKEECYPRIGKKIYWEKNAYLRSWHQQNASEEKLVDVPANIPKNYEKIRALCIDFPYDWNARTNTKLIDFVTACSAHMRFCSIYIRWNGLEIAQGYQQTTFKELFLASILQLKEIHLVCESSNVPFSNKYSIYLWLSDWLLGTGIVSRKDEKAVRKLYFINCDPSLYLNNFKEIFFKKMQKMPIFDVVFLLERGSTLINEKIKMKNIKTGQIFYSGYRQIDGQIYVWIRLCNSLEEADKEFEFCKVEEMSQIQWNIHPGKDYIRMREEMEENKAKINSCFVDLLK